MLNSTNRARQSAWQVIALFTLMAVPTRGDFRAVINPAPETVSIYLNVEKNGNLVTGLTEKNFRLYQDGDAQRFRLEKPEEPASIALLVEYSRSSGYYIEDIDAAMSGLLKHAPEGHWYALATFSHDLKVETDFTKQIGKLTEAYAQLGLPNWTEIDTYDAVYDMLDKLGRLPGRRILIVIGSGMDTFSEHTFDDVRKKIETDNVTVFVAGIGSAFRSSYEVYLDSSSRMTLSQAQSFLRMLADKSGGFAWFPSSPSAFPSVMNGIMQSIATQYRLVYDTPVRGAGKLHKIKVEAFRIVNDKREDFKVLVREGWR
ncbi:MAG TPA: VWA domain-containing protein [Bryobacteraceae bacterium]